MEQFEIAFSGQLVLGAEMAQARAAIQRLFNANEQLLDQLFSGRRMVIKQSVGRATALKYQKAFSAAGAMLEVKLLTAAAPQPAAATASSIATAARAAPVSAPAKTAAERAVATGQVAETSPADFDLAPAGVDLLPDKPHVQEPQIDISALDLAPAGSDAGYLDKGPEPVRVQIGHLQLED